MKLAGIVCEYNPFHNGHKYHIGKTKKDLNVDGVVCVMSGDVMQRGDSAVFPMKNTNLRRNSHEFSGPLL